MDLSIEKTGDATIVRIQTARVIYPLLPTLVARTKEAVDGRGAVAGAGSPGGVLYRQHQPLG